MKGKNWITLAIVVGLFLTILVSINSVQANQTTALEGYGSGGALEKGSFTLEEMLTYAIQDEYTARAEYELIMKTYDISRPFSNIMKSEETHIDMLLPLFEAYHIDVPIDESKEHIIIPETLKETYATGVQAEINNIAMYEKFLQQELPDDVREVFIRLKEASENHLRAFERGLDRY